MKRSIAWMLVLFMLLSLTACGASENKAASADPAPGSSAAPSETSAPSDKTAADETPSAPAGSSAPSTEAETTVPAPAVEEWNPSEEFSCKYENIVLLENENVRIAAKQLQYKNSDKGWRLYASMTVENRTDRDFTYSIRSLSSVSQDDLPAGETRSFVPAPFVYDWNHLIGETEDCYQNTCQLKVLDGIKTVDMIQFDWYVSRTTPFTNLLVGEEAILSAALEKDLVTEEEWNGEGQFDYEYDAGLVLMENEDVRITAGRMYAGETAESASGLRLMVSLNIENLSDRDLRVAYQPSYVFDLAAHESKEAAIRYHSDEWNRLVGGTANCYQDTCQILIRDAADGNSGPVLDAVRFDWYTSKAAPFRNIIAGAEEVLEAERRAELAALEELLKNPVHHAENELFTVDIVKVEASRQRYQITYVAKNISDSPLYVKGQDERWTAAGSWTPSKAYAPGESWYDTASYFAPNAFEDGTAELSVPVYNAIRQPVGELAFELKGSADIASDELIENPPCEISDLRNTADKEAAAAYPDLASVKPVLTVENEVLRVDVLGSYSEERPVSEDGSDSRSLGCCVYAVTNKADTPFIEGNNTLAPGETAYSTVYSGDSSLGESGESRLNVSVRLSKDDPRTAAGVGITFNWKYDPSAKEVGLSDFKENNSFVDEDVFSTRAVSFHYSGVILAETEYCRIELRSMTGEQSEDGSWRVRADFVMYNSFSSRYLLFDPGKQYAGYDPGGDWFDPGEDKWFSLDFTGKGDDPADVTGQIAYHVEGFSWDSVKATRLFDSTLTATLRLSKTDPIVH